MKKSFVLLLAALLTISMCACDQGGSDVKTDSSQVQSSAVESVEEESTDSTSFDGYDAWKEGAESLKLFTKLRAESVIGQLSGEIPSTKEEQKDSKKLIDASALDLKKLGTMNMDQKAKQADKKEN